MSLIDDIQDVYIGLGYNYAQVATKALQFIGLRIPKEGKKGIQNDEIAKLAAKQMYIDITAPYVEANTACLRAIKATIRDYTILHKFTLKYSSTERVGEVVRDAIELLEHHYSVFSTRCVAYHS